jgi:hypothetical protein
MICAPGLIFGGTGSGGSLFHVLRSQTSFRLYRCDVSHFLGLCSRTRFQRYEGRRVPFVCFALPDSFLTVSRASDPVFMFCAPALIFDVTEGIRSYFHVLHSRTHFRRYRRRRGPFSCLAFPDTFLAMRRASGPFFMICAPGLVFGGSEGVGSRFHISCARTFLRRYRGHRLPFSCFALPDTFSATRRASGPLFIFCAPELVFQLLISCFELP